MTGDFLHAFLLLQLPEPSALPMIYKDIIRPMTEADLGQVLTVEKLCHRTPWSEAMFLNELANPLSRIDLLWRGSCLAGFLCAWRVCQELSILNVATTPSMRRSGVARALLEQALVRNLEAGLECALLEVRPSNLAAIALYQSFGFCQIDRRLRYYSDGEDALVMQLIPTDPDRLSMSGQIH
jgi:[ribosomal protein S18]-alanine N-acetyltransferase